MDLRPVNQLFESVAGDLHTLPMLSQLLPLEIFPDESILISSEDIKSMFYIIGVPDVWRPLLAFGREVPSHLKPKGVEGPCVLTSRVLPMGFINSVSVAQTLRRSIVHKAVDELGISREYEIRKDQQLPTTSLALSGVSGQFRPSGQSKPGGCRSPRGRVESLSCRSSRGLSGI